MKRPSSFFQRALARITIWGASPLGQNILIVLFLASGLAWILQSMVRSGMFLTHDGNIHVIRSIHFFQEFTRGQIPVRIVPDSAWRFGYAVFLFFYPLPYYATLPFQFLGIPTTESWKLMQAVVSTLSLLAWYRWLRCHFEKLPATVGTFVATVVPFRILSLFVTGQIGATYSLLLAPLIGLSLYTLLVKQRAWGGMILAGAVAALITSHFMSVVIVGIAMGGYALVLLAQNASWRNLRALAAWGVLGLGLSAFYFFPLLLEKHWVRLGNEILISHRGHWPTLKQLIYSPWGYGGSMPGTDDGMSMQVGLSILVAVGLSSILLAWKIWQRTAAKGRDLVLPLVQCLTFFTIFFLMLDMSAPVWEVVTPLQFLQYPWRLLAGSTVVGVWLVTWLVQQSKGWQRWAVALVFVSLALYNSRNYLRPWPHDWLADEAFITEETMYLSSTDISWELLPTAVTDAPHQTVPNIVLNRAEAGIEVGLTSRPETGDARHHIEFVATKSSPIVLAVWNQPYWRAEMDGQPVEVSTGTGGEIVIPTEPGSHTVELFLQRTLVQKISDGVTVVSLLILFGSVLKAVKNTRRHVSKN